MVTPFSVALLVSSKKAEVDRVTVNVCESDSIACLSWSTSLVIAGGVFDLAGGRP